MRQGSERKGERMRTTETVTHTETDSNRETVRKLDRE